jgi:hypothetical protein
MALALFAMATLALALAASLIVGSSDIRATRNYRGATQVHFAAESAIAQALQIANKANGIGVVDYRNDVYNVWGTMFGTGARSFTPLSGFTYTVASLLDNANPTQAGWFRATATGPENVRNVVSARIVRSNIPSTAPGAIYLATDNQTNATFNGNTFQIDGNDHNYTGGAGPGAAIPGLSTRRDSNTQEAISSLSNNQMADVKGLGYVAGSPPVPSVLTSATAPSVAQVDTIVQDMLNNAGGNLVTSSNSEINNSDLPSLPGWQAGSSGIFPTPKVTHFTDPNGVTFKGGGNVMGAGIMIVDGDLRIQGTIDFYGLIIVRGRTTVGSTHVEGNANIWGSLWTDDVNMVVAGNSFVYYSTQALTLANSVVNAGLLPTPLTVTALVDCAQVPTGANGCP